MSARPRRADAVRNADALVVAAKAVFAEAGVDAPAKQIADLAGVGVGTLYRNFPRRSDLIKAVYRHEVDACADLAPRLSAQHPPEVALREWLKRYTQFIAAKRGLASALHSGDPAYDELPAYLWQRFEPALSALLAAAAEAGKIRVDVGARDLLWAVAQLATPPPGGEPVAVREMVLLLLDGMRYRADSR